MGHCILCVPRDLQGGSCLLHISHSIWLSLPADSLSFPLSQPHYRKSNCKCKLTTHWPDTRARNVLLLGGRVIFHLEYYTSEQNTRQEECHFYIAMIHCSNQSNKWMVENELYLDRWEISTHIVRVQCGPAAMDMWSEAPPSQLLPLIMLMGLWEDVMFTTSSSSLPSKVYTSIEAPVILLIAFKDVVLWYWVSLVARTVVIEFTFTSYIYIVNKVTSI